MPLVRKIIDLTDGYYSNTLLVWLTKPTRRQDSNKVHQQLKYYSGNIMIKNDIDSCIDMIKTKVEEIIFLIVSVDLATKISRDVYDLAHLMRIFIWNEDGNRHDQSTLSPHHKMIGSFDDLNVLVNRIERCVVDVDHRSLDRYVFDELPQQGTRDLSSQSSDFLWYQLFMYVTWQLPSDEKAKEDMLSACRNQCRAFLRMLRDIDEFERTYREEDCIKWYTRSTFIYMLINRALRSEKIEELYRYRYYIAHLSKALTSKCKAAKMNGSTILHHGGTFTLEDAKKFEQKIGNRIAINSYWSASHDKDCARGFARGYPRDKLLPVLFKISIDWSDPSNSIIFADISDLSEFPSEKEVLFDVGSIFQICSVRKEISEGDEIHCIELRAIHGPTEDMKEHIEEIRAEMTDESPQILFGILLKRIGRYQQSFRYFQRLLQHCDDKIAARVENRLGLARIHEGKHDLALPHCNKAFDLYFEHCLPDNKLRARMNHNMGVIQSKREQYNQALISYMKALELIDKDSRDMRRFRAEIYSSIGRIYLAQGHNAKAKCCLEKVQRLRKECLLKHHYIHACTHMDMAHYYYRQGLISEALNHDLKALRIRQKTLPQDHVDTARSLNYVGLMHYESGNHEEALIFFEQSVVMYKNCLPVSQCHQVPEMLLKIARISVNKKDMKRVIRCYSETLEVQQQACPGSQEYLKEICRQLHNLLALNS